MPKNYSPSKSALAAAQRPARQSGPGKKPPASLNNRPAANAHNVPFRSLLDGLDVGIANVTAHGLIRYANAHFAETLGVPGFVILAGNYLKQYVSAASWDALDSALSQAIRGPLQGEMTIEVEGKVRVVRLSLAPIQENSGDVSISMVAQEVTALVEASKALHDSEASVHSLSGRILRVQDEERRRIARELHDNTGQELAVIAISLDQLTAHPDQSSEQRRKTLQDCTELVHKVEDEIRTLSYVLHPPLLDQLGLGAALRWYAEGFTKRTGIQVEVDVPQKSPRFAADKETALFRVVQESLANVLRHSGSRTARLKFQVLDHLAEVSIEDQGKGMGAKKLAAANTGRTFGVGIGGMRERLRQLGGRLEIHSQSTGTRIVATLPVAEIAALQAVGVTPSEEHALEAVGADTENGAPQCSARKRILIADDHEVTRRGIRSLLSLEPDMEVCGEAKNGLDAVMQARELKPDLVILDLIMPHVGGFAAAHKIRDSGLSSKILIFTTHSYPGLERTIRASGCDGYVLKGYASADLVQGVRRVLSGEFVAPPRVNITDP